jgi:hypothetical protein
MSLAYKEDGLWDYISKYHIPLQKEFVKKVTNLPQYIFDNKDSSILNPKTYLRKIFGLRN